MANNPDASRRKEHTYRRGKLILLSEQAALLEEQPSPPGKAKTWWRWLVAYVRYRFRPKRRPASYRKLNGAGVGQLRSTSGGATTRVSVTGDWGDGSVTAGAVAGAIEGSEPDLTIHLGDIYRVGSEKEVKANFLGLDGGVTWPRKVDGSALAVPGNHEYQSGGHAFHNHVLPSLGVRGEEAAQLMPQRTSYFSLHNEHWRIVGLDTGYHSVQMLGLEGVIFLMNRFFGSSSWVQDRKTKLPRKLRKWLQGVIQADSEAPKALIFLSHHQYITALDGRGDYPKPGKQIARMLDSVRQALWIYGHEHRLAGYQLQARPGADNLNVYARAVGIGSEADPIDLGAKKIDTLRLRNPDKSLDFLDNRRPKPGDEAGYPGWADLIFDGPNLQIDYHTVDVDLGTQEIILTETFKADAGNVTHRKVVFALEDDDFLAPEQAGTG